MSTALADFTFCGSKRVRVFGTDEHPLFLAADVGAILDIHNIRMALSRLPAAGRGASVVVTGNGGPREMATVTESGLFRLIFQSRKPQAEEFMTWVTEVVLPEIRRTGRFDILEQAKRMAFERFLLNAPSEWRRTFSRDWFAAVLGVWDLDLEKLPGIPSFMGGVINTYIYEPLIEGLPQELKARRAECGKNSAKLHQFLEAEAHERLTQHLAVIRALAMNNPGSPDGFREAFDRVFRGQNQLMMFGPRKHREIA